ncbi:transporter substrate-binding domain-containing protein [Janthinobacterium sp. 17J80-10]|nr:transporter substrate-binding domain-containing protein [Janthinobacterium sp. 17J80-10]
MLPAFGANAADAADAADAASTLEKIRQRGELKTGMQYVAPEFVPGTANKFRTPENIEQALAQDLARRLGVKAVAVTTGSARDGALLKSRKADLLLALASGKDAGPGDTVIVATGYVAAPMAIMRSDTTIKTWEQLKGRSVCVPQGSRHAGLAARYGATEKPYRAAADALLGLRIGACDATIHDAALLEELLRLPEWKKFSARLAPAPGAGTPLAFVLPAGDAKARAWFEQVAQEWQASGALQQQLRLMARNIAFEVYLDQDVPDCH